MKKKVLSIAVAMAAMAMILPSCTKKESTGGNPTQTAAKTTSGTMDDMLEAEGVDADKIVTNYYIDGEASDPIADLEGVYPVFSATKDPDTRSSEITIHTFSSQEKYFEYGDEHGYQFREMDAFATEVREEARERGIDVDAEDATEELPDDFMDYVHAKYVEYFGEPEIGPFSRVTSGTGSFYGWDDFVPYGTGTVFPLATHPKLFAWNNRIGCVKGYSVKSMFSFWDKGFYRTHIATIVRWGYTNISFSGYFGLAHLNNRITSYTHVTLW